MNDWTLECRAMGMLPFAPAGTKPQLIPDAEFRTERLRPEFDLDLERKVADGTATTTLTVLANGTRSLHFHAVGMKVLGASLDEPTRRIVAARKGVESWIAAVPQRFPELRKVEWIVIWPRGRGLAGRLIGWTYNPDGRHCVVDPDEVYYEFEDFLGGRRIDVVESHRAWKWFQASGK